MLHTFAITKRVVIILVNIIILSIFYIRCCLCTSVAMCWMYPTLKCGQTEDLSLKNKTMLEWKAGNGLYSMHFSILTSRQQLAMDNVRRAMLETVEDENRMFFIANPIVCICIPIDGKKEKRRYSSLSPLVALQKTPPIGFKISV